MKELQIKTLSSFLITGLLCIVLIACGETTTTDPVPTDPTESFISTATLTANDAAANDEFGNAVAISGNYAIVGAYRNDDTGLNSGSAYIYTLNGDSLVSNN